MNNEETIAISYTVAPLEEVDGHYERVVDETPAAFASLFMFQAYAADSVPNHERPNFILSAHLARSTYAPINGEYRYDTWTYATWTKNSVLSGANYPAGHEDIITHVVPASMRIVDKNVMTKYSHTYNGATAWEKYSHRQRVDYFVVDDPFGLAQLQKANLYTHSKSTIYSKERVIHNYYVHTWDAVTVDINFEPGFVVNPQKDSFKFSIGLEIKPKLEKKSWSLHNALYFTA